MLNPEKHPDIIFLADARVIPWGEEGKNSDELFDEFCNLYKKVRIELESISKNLGVKTIHYEIKYT